jgi:Flp pilus assembly pilin Flp
MNTIIARIKDEAGGSAVEYAFLASLIAAVIAVRVSFLASELNAAYNLVASKVRLG